MCQTMYRTKRSQCQQRKCPFHHSLRLWAKKYLKVKPTETVPSIKKTMDMNVQPDDSLDAKAYRDKMLSQEEPYDEDYYFM